MYFEELYFDPACSAQGGATLDAHNGHYDEERGYHYHLTTTFPYTIGPRFYGALPPQSFTSCAGTGPGGDTNGEPDCSGEGTLWGPGIGPPPPGCGGPSGTPPGP